MENPRLPIVLFSVGLDLRMREHGVRAFAVHPGMIMTNLARHLEAADITALTDRSSSSEPLAFKTPGAGCSHHGVGRHSVRPCA